MKRLFGLAAIPLSLVVGPVPAQAQQAAPDGDPVAVLSNCIAMKSTGSDRLEFARWIVGALGSSPQVHDVVTVSPATKDKQDRTVAELFTRLMTVDCLTESRAVSKTRGQEGFKAAGGVMGRLAVQELLGNPDASAAMSSFTKYLNDEDFKKIRP